MQSAVYDGCMKASFILLAGADLLLLSLTAIMGFSVHGMDRFHQHFLLGVLSGLFTSFVHVLVFVYFIVQEKIIKQSILHDGLGASFAGRIDAMKSRILRLSMIGIASMVITIALGAAIGSFFPPTVHLIAALTALLANMLLFVLQYDLLDRYGLLFHEAFHE